MKLIECVPNFSEGRDRAVIDAITNEIRETFLRQLDEAEAVLDAVVAVDPTSPFSGGAVLGDRIRMRDLAGDRGIFIRSMASRGNLGGLAWATADAVKVCRDNKIPTIAYTYSEPTIFFEPHFFFGKK